jgi:hypothetical protein
MTCRKGDRVTSRKQIEGMNVPEVPAGTDGTLSRQRYWAGRSRCSLPYRQRGGQNALWCRCNAETSVSDNTRAKADKSGPKG